MSKKALSAKGEKILEALFSAYKDVYKQKHKNAKHAEIQKAFLMNIGRNMPFKVDALVRGKIQKLPIH
jgi:hypothetical protein